MTIRVAIINKDETRPNAIIAVVKTSVYKNIDGNDVDVVMDKHKTLRGGETYDTYICAWDEIKIIEVRND